MVLRYVDSCGEVLVCTQRHAGNMVLECVEMLGKEN